MPSLPSPARLAAAVVPALLAAAPLAAQQGDGAPPESTPARPRVGLVLSGGGARGAAHVGVLQVLEELRVPVDVVAGTSMGAVVGGLFASGMSPDDIERGLLAIDWKDAFADESPRRELDFRRKEDDRTFLIDLKLGLKGGRLVLPSGLREGQKLGLILRSELLPTIGLQHFDELPIPFRAVAADIDTGRAVVLERGDLTAAMQASMAIPGFLAPVEVDGQRLVDGGLADNLPVDVVQALGVDVVIAVDISTPITALGQYASFLGVSSQALSILMKENTLESLSLLGPDDVVVQPDLGTFGTQEFNRLGEAIARGRDATRAMADRLSLLALPPAEYGALRRGQLVTDFEPPAISRVRVETDAKLAPRTVTRRMRTRPGKPLDVDQLADDMARIYGMDIFERVDFQLVPMGETTELVVNARQKRWGPYYLRFGAMLQDDLDGDATYSVGTRLTLLPANSWGAEWRNEIQLGNRIRLLSEFFQPLSPGSPYFIAPRVEYAQQDLEIFDDTGRPVLEVEFQTLVSGLDMGRLLGNWGQLRLGAFRINANIDVETSLFDFEVDSFDETRLLSALLADTLDNSDFPHRGTAGGAVLISAREDLGAEEDFDLLELSFINAFSFGANSVIWGGDYRTALDDAVGAQDQYALGGFLNLSGLAQDSLRGNHSVKAILAGYHQLGYERRTPFGMPIYLGASFELGNVYDDREDIDLDSMLASGSLFFGMETFIGPLYVGYGLTEGGEHTAFLFLGGLPL